MTNIDRILFSYSAWIPEQDPLRADMLATVSVRDWDTTHLIEDLCVHLSRNYDWALYRGNSGDTVLPFDSVPFEHVKPDSLAKKIGALVISIDNRQGEPVYIPENELPDQTIVRLMFSQLTSPRSADRAMLLQRRRDIMSLFGSTTGFINAD